MIWKLRHELAVFASSDRAVPEIVMERESGDGFWTQSRRMNKIICSMINYSWANFAIISKSSALIARLGHLVLMNRSLGDHLWYLKNVLVQTASGGSFEKIWWEHNVRSGCKQVCHILIYWERGRRCSKNLKTAYSWVLGEMKRTRIQEVMLDILTPMDFCDSAQFGRKSLEEVMEANPYYMFKRLLNPERMDMWFIKHYWKCQGDGSKKHELGK